MQAASLPAAAGFHWVRDGYRLFRRQPIPMFTWALSIALLVLVASMLVPIGPALFIMLMPAITVMTLNACHAIERNTPVQPLRLWKLLGQPGMARKLLGMGGVYVAAVLLAGFVAFLPFMAAISEVAQSVDDAGDLQPLLAAVQAPLMLFAVFYLVIAALFWHAPVLVAWHGLTLRKALFFSGIACWRNKTAFIVYGLCWGALLLALEMAAALLRAAGLSGSAVGLIQMPFSFALAACLYCSFYPTYTTVFGAAAAPAADA